MRIRTFQALRPSPEAVENVVSLPYDVVSTEEARQLADGNPLSFLHVVRAEIDFPTGTDPYSNEVYSKAVSNFQSLQENGHLVRESEPCLYLYQQQMGEHVQQGVVALCHVADYEADLIKKHEKTRPQKEDDRTRLTSEMSANSGPVFLTYNDEDTITRMMAEVSQGDPLYDLTSDDGIRHTAWRIDGASDLVEAFKSVPAFYVADGHHRSASAGRVGRERRAANPGHTGDEDYNWFLTVLFPGGQLKILPYNRLVQDLNGHSEDELLEKISAIGPVADADSAEPTTPGDVLFYLGGKWRSLTLAPSPDADPVSSLDVSMLQDRLLTPLLGIDDPRTNDRIQFAGGIRGTGYLQEAVDSDRAAIAFSMFPVQIEQLFAISDAGQIMAPKSTWFEPKLRSGFFVHTF